MLTTAQAATRLGVAVRTIQAWIKAGKLPAQKFGRDWLIAEADLEQFTPPLMGRPKKSVGLRRAIAPPSEARDKR